MIDTDTRQLRRGKDGFYTSGAGKRPCDHCGWNTDCPLQPVMACSAFLPALPFSDETGLRKISNTVRIGVAWTNRLTPGQIVGLYNVNKKAIFGHAQVIGTSAGPIRDMLDKHAHANHLMLDRPPREAAQALYEWQLSNYGPRIVNDKTKITAIYLLRLNGAPPPVDFHSVKK